MGNSWSDIFYPDNPKRRDKVVQLASRLFTVMENNFSVVNDLVDLLNEHAKPNPSLTRVYVNRDATIESNANTLTRCIAKIQDIVEGIDKKLAEMIEPNLYRDLKSPDLTFKNRIRKANAIFTATLSVVVTVVGIALVAAILGGFIFVGVVGAIGVVATSAIAGITLGVLTMGVDMIAGAIVGAIERDKLESQIDDLEKALEKFEPASKEFQKKITYVLLSVEDYYS